MKFGPKKQNGFTLVELMVVLVVIAVLAAITVPSIKGLIFKGSGPEVGKALQVGLLGAKAARASGGDSWSNATTQELARYIKADGRLTVSGSSGSYVIQHGLGGGSSGVITFAPATISTSNDAGAATATLVGEEACAPFANSLQKIATTMTVNGTSVKAVGGSYSGGTATTACTANDTNTIVVTVQ